MTAGYQVTDHLKVTAGYDLLYWSAVVRAADQIAVGPDDGLSSGVVDAGNAPAGVYLVTSRTSWPRACTWAPSCGSSREVGNKKRAGNREVPCPFLFGEDQQTCLIRGICRGIPFWQIVVREAQAARNLRRALRRTR